MLLGAAAALLAGCARTVVEEPLLDNPEYAQSEVEFWEALEERRVVTNDDALHVLLILAEGEDPYETYEQRAAAAREMGWIGREAPPANESARVGLLAMALCDILSIEGGLTMRVFGPSPRYCTRELIHLELLPRRTSNEAFSGLELIDLIGRAEAYARANEGIVSGE